MNEITNENWYTIQNLADWCGYDVETLKHGAMNINAIMNEMNVNIDVNTRKAGYHNTQIYYSENVLKALKEYQIRNSVPNATKNKEVAVTGNLSFVQNEMNNQISNMLDDTDSLLMLVNASARKLYEANKIIEQMVHSDKTYTPNEIAKELGMKSTGFKMWLHEKGYIYMQNKDWIPYSGYEDLFECKLSKPNEHGRCFYLLHITEKGRMHLLKKYGDKNNLSKTDVLRLRKNLQDELYMQNAIENAAGKIAGEIA